MDFNASNQLKDKKSLWTDIAFYFSLALLIAVIFCYAIFSFKVYLQDQNLNEINRRIIAYSTDEQRAAEKDVFDYKKKIDAFATIIQNNKISSHVFSFIEKNTMSNVWFSDFDMSQSNGDIKLSGQSENMEMLSLQIQIFEKNEDYIKNISVLNLQTDSAGKVRFILNLSLNPKIFSYKPNI